MKWPWQLTKEYPPYWEQYESAFAKAEQKPLAETRFVALDTETTGLDIKKDRILSIGAVGLKGNTIAVSDSLELYVAQDHYDSKSTPIHGILKKGKVKKIEEAEAIQQTLAYIGTAIIIGHHIGFDIAVINKMLQRHHLGKLKNKVIDTSTLYKKLQHPVNRMSMQQGYSLDQLSEALKIPLYDRHTASGDAMITALAFIKISKRLKKDGTLKFKELFT
ncbi:3'-5' exonuclease [uncultured Dokdonia sp.]|uniref:3'-5' exonuclease n=1 Tax=uncultured Dokdonia sp. TaxID=575653 RepID=UPI00260E2CA0|nr:3'-5' exonuclease [uncultured Dokdonia sp.]